MPPEPLNGSGGLWGRPPCSHGARGAPNGAKKRPVGARGRPPLSGALWALLGLYWAFWFFVGPMSAVGMPKAVYACWLKLVSYLVQGKQRLQLGLETTTVNSAQQLAPD